MKTIEELEARLELLQKDLAELKKDKSINKRFRAEYGDEYFYVSDAGDVVEYSEDNDEFDDFRYNSRNYFKTRGQAQLALDRQIIKNKIMNIAEELNGDGVIDFYADDQCKYHIMYDYEMLEFSTESTCGLYSAEEIYCLDSKFEDVILERLTKEEIDLYYKRQS